MPKKNDRCVDTNQREQCLIVVQEPANCSDFFITKRWKILTRQII